MVGMTSQSAAVTVDVHPPKIEWFDLDAMTNTDPKGIVRDVEEYRRGPAGLYVTRPIVGHHKFAHLQSWLLPSLDLRVTLWQWNPGFPPDLDFYVDVVEIDPGERRWRVVDSYLDLAVHTGQGVDVLDSDELLGALQAGYIDAATARRAMESTYTAVDGIARHGYDLNAWLTSLDMPLSWRKY
jgi:predicted RNA-binding protein associated with RNAse of E/G family